MKLADKMRLVSEEAACNTSFDAVCKRFDEIILSAATEGKTAAVIDLDAEQFLWTCTRAKDRFVKKIVDHYNNEGFHHVVNLPHRGIRVDW